jgi:hypothetical protein
VPSGLQALPYLTYLRLLVCLLAVTDFNFLIGGGHGVLSTDLLHRINDIIDLVQVRLQTLSQTMTRFTAILWLLGGSRSNSTSASGARLMVGYLLGFTCGLVKGYCDSLCSYGVHQFIPDLNPNTLKTLLALILCFTYDSL